MTGIAYHDFYICGTCQAMVAENTRLQTELDTAESDPIWGVHSRQGIERRMTHLTIEHAVIVIDLDDMHGRNALFGHDGVDARINRVMRIADVLAGRWLRGDELVLFPLRNDAIGLAHRLLGALMAHDLSATIAVVWDNTHVGIAIGLARIEVAKAAGERGRVFVVDGGAAC